MAEQFKSPRKVEEEITGYKRKRFEDYMLDVEKGKITLALACAALRDEVAYTDLRYVEVKDTLGTTGEPDEGTLF